MTIHYPYGSSIIYYNNGITSSLLPLIATIIAIVVTTVLLCTFLKDGKEDSKKGFTKMLYSFLKFDKLCAKKVCEVLYLMFALYFTIYGALLLFVNPTEALKYIVLYNLVLRLCFEAAVVLFNIEKNTKTIAKCFYPVDDDFNEDDYEDLDLTKSEDNTEVIIEEASENDEEKIETEDNKEPEENKE